MTTRSVTAHWPLLLALAGIVVMAGALGSQYLAGYAPCEMCHWQRWPWIAAIVLGLGAAAARGRRATPLRRGLLAAAGIVVLAGAAIAAFHAGVENHWWQGFTACAVPISGGMDVAQLREQLLATPAVRCDEAPFRLLGLSMAGMNALVSVAVGVATLVVARRA